MSFPRIPPLARHATLAIGFAACAPSAAPPAGRPRAEFLLSAGDSTYWISSEPQGVRMRASSMFLARYGGRLYEVYAADDDRSFYDAVFTTQRIYRRDLIDGDSLPVFDDATVPTLARRYAAAHPHESPLGPDDDAAEDPHTVASTEVSLVDVHGPYLTYDARADIDVPDQAERRTTRRAVVDLRTARPATLAAMFGPAAADAVVAQGRLALGRALDSVRALADSGEDVGARALHALPTFRFLPDNFGLAVDGERPAIVFVSLGHDVDGHVVTLPLPPVVVPGAVPAWWAGEVRDALPATSADSTESRWRLAGTEVVARYEGSRDAAALTLRAPVRSRTREWLLGRVAGPARQLYALDRPPLDATSRRALARAFNESALYDDAATSAAYHRPRASSGERRVWSASALRPAPHARRVRPARPHDHS
ncbi:MAG: hypothetical protein JO180_06630 [Gemmatirosa sp.]|nr:hypothetical protein [Gemmatirosa sp.]